MSGTVEYRRQTTVSKVSGEDNPATFTLTSLNDGTGVTTFIITVSNDTEVTLDGNANFYSDASGTADESQSWMITSGAARTRYIKCTSGTSSLVFANSESIIEWGNSIDTGWTGEENSPYLTGDIGQLTNLQQLRFGSYSNLSGDITDLTSLTYFRNIITNTITGDITNHTALTYLRVSGSNTIYGDISTNSVPNGCTYFYLNSCAMVSYAGSGVSWPNISITINPSAGYGYSSTEIDQILIDMAASGLTGVTITLQGNNAARTSASDAAYSTLSAGCTLNLN